VVAEEAAAGLQTVEGELAAVRWLDAEDATMWQVLAWGMDHDADVALRLAVALAPWWFLRGRLAGQYPLLCQAAGHAVPGSAGWCAAQFWLGRLAGVSGDAAASLGHFTALRDAAAEREPSRVLADGLALRAATLSQMGRYAAKSDAPVKSTDFNGGTNDPKYAETDQKTGQPVSNGARDLWVTERSLTTALYLAYTGSAISLFGIVVGIALLLSGIGFLILALSGAIHRVPLTRSTPTEPVQTPPS